MEKSNNYERNILDISIKWKESFNSISEKDKLRDEYLNDIVSFLDNWLGPIENDILKYWISISMEKEEETSIFELILLLSNKSLITDSASNSPDERDTKFWLISFEEIENKERFLLELVNKLQESLFNAIWYNMWYLRGAIDGILESDSSNDVKINKIKDFLKD